MRVTGEREAWEYTVKDGRHQCRDGGCQTRNVPRYSRRGRHADRSPFEFHILDGGDGGFQRPNRQELDLNSSTGALGLYNNAGALIGRSWSLLSMNATGGSVPGHTYEGVQGNPMADIPAVFAENVAGLPAGWKPLNVQKGFQPNESVVSTFDGCQSQNTMMVLQDENWQGTLKRFHPGLGSPQRGGKLLLVDLGDTPDASVRLRLQGKAD